MERKQSASIERLAKFVEFVLTRPYGEPEWLKNEEAANIQVEVS